MSPFKYFIYTDASFSHKQELAVSGFLVFDNEFSHEQNLVPEIGISTLVFNESNNIRAEIFGAIHALKNILLMCQQKKMNMRDLEIHLYSDCQTITKILTRREKLEANNFTSQRTKDSLRNSDLYKEFFLIYDQIQPQIYWVEGHSKKENQSFIHKNFELVDREVRKELRIRVNQITQEPS